MVRNDDHFPDGAIPAEIAVNLNEFLPEFGDLNYDELLQHQECVYQSLKRFDGNNDRRSYTGQSSNSSQFSGHEGQSSQDGSFNSQLALDEALARSLQELEDNFGDLDVSQSASTATGNREVSSRVTPETPVMPVNRNVTQDDIDPDNMTYEQLRSLGDSVGSENKGLSNELISRLSKFKHKTGFFSKNKEKRECVICYMTYKNGDKLTALPCLHQYHSKCIISWLKLSKLCPVCQEEVCVD